MPIKIGLITLYSVKELSKKLNITIVTLRAYLRQGRLRGRKIGRKWYVSEESLKEYFNGIPRYKKY